MKASVFARSAGSSPTDSPTWSIFSSGVLDATEHLIAHAPKAARKRRRGPPGPRSRPKTPRPPLDVPAALGRSLGRSPRPGTQPIRARARRSAQPRRFDRPPAQLGRRPRDLPSTPVRRPARGREAAQAALEDVLKEDSFQALVHRLNDVAPASTRRILNVRRGRPEPPVSLGETRLENLGEGARALDESSADEDFHEVRKRASARVSALEAIYRVFPAERLAAPRASLADWRRSKTSWESTKTQSSRAGNGFPRLHSLVPPIPVFNSPPGDCSSGNIKLPFSLRRVFPGLETLGPAEIEELGVRGIKNARFKNARCKNARCKNARFKNARFKNARFKTDKIFYQCHPCYPWLIDVESPPSLEREPKTR